MSRQCPKCNYVRKPSDLAPDYECPSCGIIYKKYDTGIKQEDSVKQGVQGTALQDVTETADTQKKTPLAVIFLILCLCGAFGAYYFNGKRLFAGQQARLITQMIYNAETFSKAHKNPSLAGTFLINTVPKSSPEQIEKLKNIRKNLYKKEDFYSFMTFVFGIGFIVFTVLFVRKIKKQLFCEDNANVIAD